ncbi:hypothetical protein [Romboutsia sp. MSSM.1001216sp_RTP31141st1_G3_RTP31141_220114]|uniref:hypothetical protein n=1 Tax=unclassified Romboutsia TaxID=2626894 RepID=UPI0031B5861B
MLRFKLKKTIDENKEITLSNLKYPIKNNVDPPKKNFEINELEKEFFNYLYENLDEKDNNAISLTRMYDGRISVKHWNGYVGSVKLQGKKHYIQVSYSYFDSETIYGDLEELIPKIDFWIMYIRVYLNKP